MEFNRAFDPFRALQSSWKAFTQAPWPLLVGGILLCLTSDSGSGDFGFVFRGDHDEFSWRELRPFLFPLIGLCGCVAIGLFLFSSWIRIGFSNTVEGILRTGQGKVEQIFQSKGLFGSMVLARLLSYLISFAVWIPMIVAVILVGVLTQGFERNEELVWLLIPAGLIWLFPALYVWLGVSLADQAVALEGLQPVDAVKRSWSLVSGHRLMLLLFYIVMGIFGALGFCLCCIGVFLTGTLSEVARSDGYLALVRGDRSGWWIEKGDALPTAQAGWGTSTPPPPPPPPS